MSVIAMFIVWQSLIRPCLSRLLCFVCGCCAFSRPIQSPTVAIYQLRLDRQTLHARGCHDFRRRSVIWRTQACNLRSLIGARADSALVDAVGSSPIWL
jgi:hypothetical protein